jgi:hypothetical protein
MTESITPNPELLSAEVTWDTAAGRLSREGSLTWSAGIRTALALAAVTIVLLLESPPWWASLVVIAVLWGAAEPWVQLWKLRSTAFTRRVHVSEEGVLIETDQSAHLFPWEEIAGFAGALQRIPGPVAPRMTTGGLPGSLRLKAGEQWFTLRPLLASGDLPALGAIIERQLLARARS